MKLYVLTSKYDRCIEGIFTSLEILNKYREQYPEIYSDIIILESDYFPKKEEKDIMYVKVSEEWRDWIFKTRKVELDKKNNINKIFRSVNGGFSTYVYSSGRFDAIKKASEIFKNNGINLD